MNWIKKYNGSKFFFLAILLFLNFTLSAKEIKLNASPGGTYVLNGNSSNLKISIIGSGSKDKPFVLDGKNFTLTGASYIKIDNNSSYIIIKNIKFKNVDVSLQSSSVIEIGKSKKSNVNHVTLDNLAFGYNNKGFKDRQQLTQFHWINVWGNNVLISNSSFSGKRNRLPIIHVNSNFNNIKIFNNIFKDVPLRDGDALEAIRVGLADGSSSTIIENNTFENYYGDSEVVSIKADGVKIINNIFLKSRSGISIRYANNCTVENNEFDNVDSPLRIAGQNHVIKNNQFLKNKNKRAITFMAGGKNYPYVNNIKIQYNKFTYAMEMRIINMIGNDKLPTNIEYKQNIVSGTLVKDIFIKDLKDFISQKNIKTEIRKDKSKVLIFNNIF